MTYSKPREIHIHMQIRAPENNSLKVFRIYPIPFTIPRHIEKLRKDLHNYRHKTLVDILTPKKFDEEKTITNIRTLTTMQIGNFPKYVVLNEKKVICQTESITNDLIMVDDCESPSLYVQNSTLFFNFTKTDKIIKSYDGIQCSVKFLPSLQIVLINTNKNLRIFSASVRDPRYCTKNCILKQFEKTPDCFEYEIANPYKTEYVEVNLELEKFIKQNKSEIFDKLALEIANKVNQKIKSNDGEELQTLFSKMKKGVNDHLIWIIIICLSLVCFIFGCFMSCYFRSKISNNIRYHGASGGLIFTE